MLSLSKTSSKVISRPVVNNTYKYIAILFLCWKSVHCSTANGKGDGYRPLITVIHSRSATLRPPPWICHIQKSEHFSSCDLDFDTMNSILTRRFWRRICIPKMNFLGQGFEKLQQIILQTECDGTQCRGRIRGWWVSVTCSNESHHKYSRFELYFRTDFIVTGCFQVTRVSNMHGSLRISDLFYEPI